MEKLSFEIKINATCEKVWNTLWQDRTFREWADIIDQGTYMVGDLKVGNKVEFISAENGYGVTSLVENLIPNQLLVLKHEADTQNSGKHSRKDEWTGGTETYELKEENGFTSLIAKFDTPAEMINYFNNKYPKALERVKKLAEE
jgi:uncharacterized protein YndB with AHSA1/START domain